MSETPSYPARASVPIGLTFHAPTTVRAGRWAIYHADGTPLFESEVESVARARLEQLDAILRKRIDAGLAVTGRDVLVIWPKDSPAALLGAGGDEGRGSGPRVVVVPARPAAAPSRLSATARDELIIERGERYAREAGIDVERATARELVPHFERARRDLRNL